MTSDRKALAAQFLKDSGWSTAARTDLAGDASMRRYERLRLATGESAVLMDAPPATNANVGPFVTIARHLGAIGLSAPRILGEDSESGFLLLEDLGDDLFARVISKQPRLEGPLYEAATEVLIALHHATPPRLEVFGPETMADQASLVFETWASPITEQHNSTLTKGIQARFLELLTKTTGGEKVLILRDYHAENLLWLPDRDGVARVGLLDFQDAMLAHPAYDLVSLLQDVRRDVSADVEQAMIARYISRTGQHDHDFRVAYAVLGVQRNLRILAVFARLAGTFGKPYYATLIPRTWAHVMRGLAHPALTPIATTLIDTLPPPTRPNLQKLLPS